MEQFLGDLDHLLTGLFHLLLHLGAVQQGVQAIEAQVAEQLGEHEVEGQSLEEEGETGHGIGGEELLSLLDQTMGVHLSLEVLSDLAIGRQGQLLYQTGAAAAHLGGPLQSRPFFH